MTYTNPQRKRSGHIVLATADRHVAVLPGDDLYRRAEEGEFGAVAPAPEPDPNEAMDAERAGMVCTPAQMRLALHRMGLLSQVQDIADGDPEASIVWEYATQIVRTSPLIEALGTDFTPEQIDDIFRAAIAIET